MKAYRLTTKAYYSLYAEGKYRLRYLPGTTVTADPATLGIMVFPELNVAMDFLNQCTKHKNNTILLEVECGDCMLLHRVCNDYTELYLDMFYKRIVAEELQCEAFPGTAMCRSVKVLRQIAFPQ